MRARTPSAPVPARFENNRPTPTPMRVRGLRPRTFRAKRRPNPGRKRQLSPGNDRDIGCPPKAGNPWAVYPVRMDSAALRGRVASFIDRHELIPAGGAVTCFVSGGADSTCLWHVLTELGYRVSALHVN